MKECVWINAELVEKAYATSSCEEVGRIILEAMEAAAEGRAYDFPSWMRATDPYAENSFR